MTGTTTTVYVGSLADYSTTAGVTTHVNHYIVAGHLIALRDSALHYLVADQLGSPVLQLSASGAAEQAVLRAPYGTSRYGASQLFSYGFTGQRQDDVTGLAYYHARYYDPALGQFAQADTDGTGGLNRYAYVGGNPTTATDPTGHHTCVDDTTCGTQLGPAPTPPPSPPPPPDCQPDCPSPCDPSYCQQPPPPACQIDCQPNKPTTDGGAPFIEPLDLLQKCGAASGNPSWCSRYVNSDGGLDPGAMFSHKDYLWFLLGAGPILLGVQGVLYYILATHTWYLSLGGSFGIAVGLPVGFAIVQAGFGTLLTEGTPTSKQVVDFLRHLTVSYTETYFVGFSVVRSPNKGLALQGQVANGFDLADSAGWTFDPNDPPACNATVFPPLPANFNPACNAG